jgi:hypothetical protein
VALLLPLLLLCADAASQVPALETVHAGWLGLCFSLAWASISSAGPSSAAGIDLSPYMLAVASHMQRQRQQQSSGSSSSSGTPERLRFRHCAAEDTKLPPESFDLVSIMLVSRAAQLCCAGLVLLALCVDPLLLSCCCNVANLPVPVCRCATSCLLPPARQSSRRRSGCCAPAARWQSW